jgi:uncharacterized DUF497 family protein
VSRTHRRVSVSLDFEGDEANLEHIRIHGVTSAEVEESTGRRHQIVEANEVDGDKRWKLFGKTASGRYVLVVFTIRGRRFRTITAYTMNPAEGKIHAPQID